MKETQTPAGRELSMPELYGEGPVTVHLRDIYALPGMPYGKESAESFAPLLQSVRDEGIRNPVRLIPAWRAATIWWRATAAVMRRWPPGWSSFQQTSSRNPYRRSFGKLLIATYFFPDDVAPTQSGQTDAPKRIITHIQEMFGVKGRRLQSRKRDGGRER